jgi:hypothetical protein
MRTRRNWLIAAAICSSFVQPSTSAAEPDWAVYENRTVGLTFRYPRGLRTREAPDYIRAGVGARAVIELVGKTELEPDAIVLRFIIDPFKDPQFGSDSIPTEDYLAHERTGCNSFSYLTIDGHRALNCVTCGRAACSWTLMLEKPVRCNILSFTDRETFGNRTAMRPHDSRFPILSILRTIRFTQITGTPKQ